MVEERLASKSGGKVNEPALSPIGPRWLAALEDQRYMPIVAHEPMEIVRVEPLPFIFTTATGGEIFRVTPEGRVLLGPGVKLDEASRAFWAAVGRMAPVGRDDGLRDRLAARVAAWRAIDRRDLSAGAMIEEIEGMLREGK